MKKVLVFAPHPDDDLIGCGGSIAKHIKKGNEVAIAYMTSGESGSLKYSKEELAKIREQEAKNAAAIIGVKEVYFLKNPDGYLEYCKESLIKVIELIRTAKPDIVYIPHEFDGHKDHQATHKLVTEACGRAGGPWFQECSGEPWSVQTILCYEVWVPLQNITYVEDITDFIELKVKALGEHKSQLDDISYDEAVKCLNRYRGIMAGGGKYSECFQILKTSSY
jgi:LmbE family N-acetylglucosaminyl deacetylase